MEVGEGTFLFEFCYNYRVSFLKGDKNFSASFSGDFSPLIFLIIQDMFTKCSGLTAKDMSLQDTLHKLIAQGNFPHNVYGTNKR